MQIWPITIGRLPGVGQKSADQTAMIIDAIKRESGLVNHQAHQAPEDDSEQVEEHDVGRWNTTYPVLATPATLQPWRDPLWLTGLKVSTNYQHSYSTRENTLGCLKHRCTYTHTHTCTAHLWKAVVRSFHNEVISKKLARGRGGDKLFKSLPTNVPFHKGIRPSHNQYVKQVEEL